jgi:hypothetical protein
MFGRPGDNKKVSVKEEEVESSDEDEGESLDAFFSAN